MSPAAFLEHATSRFVLWRPEILLRALFYGRRTHEHAACSAQACQQTQQVRALQGNAACGGAVAGLGDVQENRTAVALDARAGIMVKDHD